MDNKSATLKNAFIDAQLVGYTVKQHTFSDKFEAKMQHIIKYQKGILRLIESIPSKNAEPFKVWLAQMGKERIDEVFDPELAVNRAVDYYRSKRI